MATTLQDTFIKTKKKQKRVQMIFNGEGKV